MLHDIYKKYLKIKDDVLYKTDANGACQNSFGIVAFLRMIGDHVDLRPLQLRIEQEILSNPHNAAALLDSAYLMFITGNNAYAMQRQQAAFNRSVFFKIRQSSSPSLRVLVLAAPGGTTCNTPIEFLLQNDEIDTTFWYVFPNTKEIKSIPEHDIVIVTAAISDFTKPSTDCMQKILQHWPKPIINRIENIQKFSRDQFFTIANTIAGIYIPETKMMLHSDMTGVTTPYPYPFIIRPKDSHGGRSLARIEKSSDFSSYLSSHHETEFFVSPFIDYSSEDGLFRKYRIAVIDGKAFPCHLAISEKWSLWYYNAEMKDNAKKLAEEDDFLLNFDLGKKHGEAINQLAKKIGSEYFVLDCAETKTGELLIFEGGHDMIVHDLDSPTLYPVKNAQMQKLFHAFQMMLKSHV